MIVGVDFVPSMMRRQLCSNSAFSRAVDSAGYGLGGRTTHRRLLNRKANRTTPDAVAGP
jgi:hypothetical protein